MTSRVFKHTNFISFEFTPEDGEIIEGARAIYTDVLGRLHISLGYQRSKAKQKRILKGNQKLMAQVMDTLVMKPKRTRRE